MRSMNLICGPSIPQHATRNKILATDSLMYGPNGWHLRKYPYKDAKQNPQQCKQPLASNCQFEQRPIWPTMQCNNAHRKEDRWDDERIPTISEDESREGRQPLHKLRPIVKLIMQHRRDSADAKIRVGYDEKARNESANSGRHKTNIKYRAFRTRLTASGRLILPVLFHFGHPGNVQRF